MPHTIINMDGCILVSSRYETVDSIDRSFDRFSKICSYLSTTYGCYEMSLISSLVDDGGLVQATLFATHNCNS